MKLVLLAGPSSSGKTTTCKRLSIQLLANGLKPLQISLDDYFVDRHHTPKDESGELDYESIYALNLPLINEQFSALFRGEEVELPKYNFQTGMSERSGKRLRMDENNVLVVEGIHALNPELTALIPEQQKFRVYASALTTILLDTHNYIPTTDNRLLRRIIRDYKYRGVNARDTIRRWPSVRAGENKWIFPYQENADAMFNTAMLFEFAVIRPKLNRCCSRCPRTVRNMPRPTACSSSSAISRRCPTMTFPRPASCASFWAEAHSNIDHNAAGIPLGSIGSFMGWVGFEPVRPMRLGDDSSSPSILFHSSGS